MGKTSGVILAAILNQSPVAPMLLNPEVPMRLQEVMNNCLEKDPELRYPDAAGLRADLRRIRRDLESGHSRVLGVAAATSRVESAVSRRESEQRLAVDARLTPQPRARRWLFGALAMTAVAAVIMSVWIWSRKPTTSPLPTTSAVRAPDAATQEARAAIDRFDEALGRARRLLASGDLEGASAAVTVASTIDPQSAAVAELSQRISQQRRQSGGTNPRASATQPPAAPSPSFARATPTADPPNDQRSATQPTEPVAAPQPAATRGSTSGAAPTVPAPSPPPPQEPVVVNAQPAGPIVELPPQPAQPPRPTETVRPRDDAPGARGRTGAPQSAMAEDDESIRRVIDTWAQAIERKDLAAYRAVKPNLSTDEVRRIQEGFRAVSSQRVAITILGIDHQGQNMAVVRVRRRDTIIAGGRQQTADIQQTMTVARSGTGWIISEIGR